MIEFQFTNSIINFINKLSSKDKDRILLKLKNLQSHTNIFSVIRRIRYFEPITHRLRVGNYRLLMRVLENQNGNITFLINKIGHRRDIYL